MKYSLLFISIQVLAPFTYLSASESIPRDQPKRIQMVRIAEGVLEVADSQFESEDYLKALDSYAWVLDNLWRAPVYLELMQETYEKFVKTLNLSPPNTIIEFGIDRARKFALEIPEKWPSIKGKDLEEIKARLADLESSESSNISKK